ncbi:unnamed protein product [Diabrotica balteata]|uniref:Citrate transporter-like domain-containing protein n=1 Tax=Diabrotica balteata TaxID=107213 RepID=A0A9N9XA55_DIABA|nr:unnamed protein product [Diabrotica balteata]
MSNILTDLKREIAVWERTAASVSSYSKDENIVKESLLKQMAQLQTKLKDTVNHCKTASAHVNRVENLKKQALSRLGLIDYIGKQTQYVITSVGPESRLATAIVLILWVSAVASAFVDNLPLTTMMIKIATDLSHNEELHLPLPPLIWALSFGSCLGGNGSLFGSSSNIICAGVAEQHGYRFSFLHFTKVGLPVMITSTIIITMYLLVCHVILDWQ